MGALVDKMVDSKDDKGKENGNDKINKVVQEMLKSPVATNASFGFVLVGVERLVEMQFECPCKTVARNQASSLAFFIVPAFLSFLLMLVVKIQDCMCGDMASMFAATISSIVPSIIWMVLLFLDGRYFTCAMTDWPGRFVDLKDSSAQKWCEPFENATCIYRRNKPGTLQQCMLKSQGFFVTSQWIGIGLLVFICLATIEYIIGKHYRKHYRDNVPAAKEPGNVEMQMTEHNGGDVQSIVTPVIPESGSPTISGEKRGSQLTEGVSAEKRGSQLTEGVSGEKRGSQLTEGVSA